MRTLMTSTAFVFLLTPAALADQNAVVDFNGDGVISEKDYIGPKSVIVETPAMQPAKYAVQETRRVVEVPGSVNAVPASEIALEPGYDKSRYVHIGEYKGGSYGTLEATPARQRVVVERKRVMVSPPVPGIEGAQIHPQPHGPKAGVVAASLRSMDVYTPPVGHDGVITAAEMGWASDRYGDSGLGMYDTNNDGIVTSNEAVSNLDPLMDPNVEAVRDAYVGTNEIVTPESKDLGQ